MFFLSKRFAREILPLQLFDQFLLILPFPTGIIGAGFKINQLKLVIYKKKCIFAKKSQPFFV
jgi:hypothetical protein